MAKIVPLKVFLLLILLLLSISACTQTPEPTQAPTTAPTPTVPAPTQTSAPVEKQVIILPSQVVVDQIEVMELDPDSGEIEVVVQGSTSNSCTSIKGINISRDGGVFLLQVEASFEPGPDCEEETTRFKEVVFLEAQDLDPGSYLVTSGVVQSFEVGSDQITEEPENPVEESAIEGDTPSETGTIADETGISETTTSADDAVSDEPRDCQDNAVFLADITFPDNTEVAAGEAFTKTWEIRNEGSCTWGPGYELEFVSGTFEQLESIEDTFPSVHPAESMEISVVVTAPDTAGTHSGTWVIKRPEGDSIETQPGQAFDLWAVIIVPRGADVVTIETRDINEEGVVCAQTNAAYEVQILQLINDTRVANGLPAYELQPQLSNAAQVLTIDMACNDFVSHIGSDGTNWYDRITAQEYTYEEAAENILFGYGTVPQLALNWWMDSQVYSDNILNASMTQIGIAYALNPQTSASYYTLVFAAPE